MSNDTRTIDLVINNLTEEQFENTFSPDPNELWLTPDDTPEKLAQKVDKTSDSNKVYGTDAQGNQTTYNKSGFQDKLTPGTNITIDANNVISSTSTESFFRGRWNDWNSVPSDTQYYPEDFHNNRVPEKNDYIVLDDASGYISTETNTITIYHNRNYAYIPYDYYDEQTKTTTRYDTGPQSRKTVLGQREELYISVPGDGDIYIYANKDDVIYNNTLYNKDELIVQQGWTGAATWTFYFPSDTLVGSWRFSYYGIWATDGKNGWKPEYQVEDVLPIATDTVSGIAKLYTTTGSNTDGAVDQATVTSNITNLQTQINDLSGRGRYLTLWDCSTGLALTDPPVNPYVYKPGDYFIVAVVAQSDSTNYKPDGLSYTIGVASTTPETEDVSVDDTYVFDGEVWRLQKNSTKTTTFASIAGSPYDNTSLATALNSKQDTLSSGDGITINNNIISTDNIIWRKW